MHSRHAGFYFQKRDSRFIGKKKKHNIGDAGENNFAETITSSAKLVKNQGPVFGKFQQDSAASKGAWQGVFVLSFLAGLAALLTPCVFPMIPITVSFFTGRGTKMQALFYGFSIIFIFTVVGALLAPLMGPETANDLATEWLPNLIFFLVFVGFGLSFLGLFDITLPNAFINKVDKQAEKGGWIGVFFMAFTLVLVSFSCTGPLVGSILVSSAGGGGYRACGGHARFLLGLRHSLLALRFLPGVDAFFAQVGGLAQHGESDAGIFRNCFCFQIPEHRRPSLSLAHPRQRSEPRHLDCDCRTPRRVLNERI